MSNAIEGKAEIPTGTLIDNRYLIQKVLGQGGLGRTYLAFDTHRFQDPCVLKEFAPLGSGQYDLEKSRELFKREAQILHQISHPQIPKFLACFEGKSRLFLVQEYVKGKTYSAILQERQKNNQVFQESEVIRWLMNILPILDYIHKLGIIHRDISPDNIMIMQPEGKTLPVLIDFGVGKLTNIVREQKQLNSDNYSYVGKMSFVGKIGYAPREQIGMGICSPSSDIYALGVTALVLLTGKNPTSLVNSYSLEWEWHNYVRVSQEFTEILDKMTKERPQERYNAANAVLLDIQQKIIDCHTSIVVPTRNNEFQSSKLDSIFPCSPPDSATLINQENTFNENAVVDCTQPLTSKSLTDLRPANTNNVLNLSKKQPTIEPKFVQRCQKELAYFIGPMASLIIDEVLMQSASKSPEAFVNDLAEQIPDSQQAIKFKRLLLET
ncbi:MAG: serine/threonine protein kinase [Pleurocapsa minor HA4230-MV1]|jgi:serine/threonine-protein kinase|nr:serine/threonine protein kinase [Pleurocapsa minor HA4230-MV1]